MRHTAEMHPAGLDEDGFIAREGDLTRVPEAFRPVVQAAKTDILSAFGPERLHSAYLYGSIPRGTAVPGVSDLDVLLALRHEPADADRATARSLEAALDARFPRSTEPGSCCTARRRYSATWNATTSAGSSRACAHP